MATQESRIEINRHHASSSNPVGKSTAQQTEKVLDKNGNNTQTFPSYIRYNCLSTTLHWLGR